MTANTGVLALLDQPGLRAEVDRVAAAVGVRVVHAATAPTRRGWSAAAAVVLDEGSARQCATAALPRRARVLLLGDTAPSESRWQAAISVGAEHVLTLPLQERELVAELAKAGEPAHGVASSSGVIAVVGGRGGAGASTFAAALALTASDALLVDIDPWSGGIDLLIGTDGQPGLRWPDLALEGGRLNFAALRGALPRRQQVSVLSGTRTEYDIGAAALTAVVDAGRRGGVTVVCDLPRQLTPAMEAALDAADLVVLVGPCDVRACAAAAAMAPALAAVNPNVGLVVRGPSPGGLRAAEVARVAALPLLAKMRPQPRLGTTLERGGVSPHRRSPLASAARRVLTVLRRHPSAEAA
jgi:secretion/DNA translocation related CpaE-like protein